MVRSSKELETNDKITPLFSAFLRNGVCDAALRTNKSILLKDTGGQRVTFSFILSALIRFQVCSFSFMRKRRLDPLSSDSF